MLKELFDQKYSKNCIFWNIIIIITYSLLLFVIPSCYKCRMFSSRYSSFPFSMILQKYIWYTYLIMLNIFVKTVLHFFRML